jgi:geranylgeranyl reductase family protein
MASFDVIIVGAGPAGSSLAMRLSKNKRKVLLLDKAVFPRDKVCGDGLSGKTVGLLRELGLEETVAKKSSEKILGVLISSPAGTLLDIPMPRNNYGYCCRRELFDNLLFQKAKALVETREGFQVTGLLQENGFVVGVKGKDLSSGKEAEFRSTIVVAADGNNSVVANQLGLGTNPPEHHIAALRAYYEGVSGLQNRIEIHFIDEVLPGYFWIFPVDNGKANVGVGMVARDIQKQRRDLKKSMEKAMRENPLFKERFRNAKLIGSIRGWGLPLGSHKRKSAGNGWLFLGDAASLIDPFTGEGIGNALFSAKLASQEIERCLNEKDFSEENLKRYNERLDAELYPELKTSYNLQRLANHQWLLNFVVNKAKKKPEVARFLGESLTNDQPREKLASVWSLIKLFFL